MSSKVFGAALLPLGLGLLYLMHFVVARNLSVSDYGIFALVITLCSLLSILLTAGLPGSAQKFISSYLEKQDHQSLAGFIRFSGLWLVGVALVLFVFSLVLRAGLLGAAGIELYIALPLATFATCVWLWQRFFCLGQGWIVRALLPRELLFPILMVAVVLWFELRDVQLILLIYSASLLLVCAPTLLGASLVGAKIVNKAAAVPSGLAAITKAKVGEWLRTARSLVISNALQLGLNGWDILILGAFASLAETGQYAVATRFAMGVMIVVRIAQTLMGHRFAAMHARGSTLENQAMFQSARRLCLFSGLSVFALLLLAMPILLPLLGEGYQGIEPIVFLMAIANLAVVSMGPVIGFLNMTGQEAFVARCMTIWSVLSIVLNLVLIPIFGLWGAVAAFAICNVGLRVQLCMRSPVAMFGWKARGT